MTVEFTAVVLAGADGVSVGSLLEGRAGIVEFTTGDVELAAVVPAGAIDVSVGSPIEGCDEAVGRDGREEGAIGGEGVGGGSIGGSGGWGGVGGEVNRGVDSSGIVKFTTGGVEFAAVVPADAVGDSVGSVLEGCDGKTALVSTTSPL